MEYREILYSEKGPIAFITLNNPSKINALSKLMVRELKDVLNIIGANENIKAAVIKAEGKHFCAGHYLPEMLEGGIKEYQEIFDECTAMMELIHEIPQPVIAQVHGVATAAGCQLVAWCDLAVAEEGAKFATPGVRIGLFCTTPGVAIVRAIGRKAAMEMLLTGRFFPAREAKDLGLINMVVPLDQLAAETEALAMKIAEASRYTIGLGKRAFYAQVDQTDDAAYDIAVDAISMNLSADDAQAGIRAFIDKKTPVWKNR